VTEFRVRFAETDQMRVAHHGAYAAWLEVGRVEWLRDQGYAYTTLEAQGVSLAVVELRLRYHHAARFDDLLRIETRLESAGSRGCTFAYGITRAGDGALVATGTTRHVAVDRDGRTVRLPDDWHTFLRERLAAGRDSARC
jgi:acyl-CoA thioester hydrolase